MRSPASGFTLIELVVALAVLSMLSLLVVQALNLAHRSWKLGTDVAEGIDSVATVQQSLRRSLSQLLPVQKSQGCTGDGRTLTWLAPRPDSSVTGGTARYRLSVDTAGGSDELNLQWCGYDAGQAACPPSGTSQEELLDHLQSASFEYFQGGRWSSSWTDCSTPPRLVRIDVRFPDKDRRSWPDLVIEPRYGAAADCAFDLVSMKCASS